MPGGILCTSRRYYCTDGYNPAHWTIRHLGQGGCSCSAGGWPPELHEEHLTAVPQGPGPGAQTLSGHDARARIFHENPTLHARLGSWGWRLVRRRGCLEAGAVWCLGSEGSSTPDALVVQRLADLPNSVQTWRVQIQFLKGGARGGRRAAGARAVHAVIHDP